MSANSLGKIAKMKMFLTVITLLFFSKTALATAQIAMNGTLEILNCTINNDKTQDISFGDSIASNKIDGGNYTVELPLEVTCNADPNGTLNMNFDGPLANFSNGLLAVNNNPDLAIQFMENGKIIALKEPFSVNYKKLPELTAVLVKKTGSEIPAGIFNAEVTLLVVLL